MELTLDQLMKCAHIDEKTAAKWLAPLNDAMREYQINTPNRVAAFIAQVCVESGNFKWLKEIWGPTDAQKRYEGRKDLGNTHPGDGSLFRGRGLLQVTGRNNYGITTKKLQERFPDAPDFVAKPQALEEPKWAALSAARFFSENGCSHFADVGEITRVSKIINGGTNGLRERIANWEHNLKVLA